MSKYFLSEILAIIIVGIIFILFGFLSPVEKKIVFWNSRNNLNNLQTDKEGGEGDIKKLWLAGDIMLDRGVKYKVKQEGGGDWKFPFQLITPHTEEIDLFFANLEGPISYGGKRQGSIYSFRFSPETLKGLDFSNINIVSLANNHMLDYGRVALLDTFRYLEEKGISYVGAGKTRDDAFRLKTVDLDGLKIGFLAYTDMGSIYWQAKSNYSGIAWIDKERIDNVYSYIKKIKREKLADILVVSIHTGVEYSKKPNYFQKEFAHNCIDAGADIIAGHHPHVVQSVEKYKNGYIAYSLGNFLFDQGFSEETMKGLILEIQIQDKKIINTEEKKIVINSNFQPNLVNDQN